VAFTTGHLQLISVTTNSMVLTPAPIIFMTAIKLLFALMNFLQIRTPHFRRFHLRIRLRLIPY